MCREVVGVRGGGKKEEKAPHMRLDLPIKVICAPIILCSKV